MRARVKMNLLQMKNKYQIVKFVKNNRKLDFFMKNKSETFTIIWEEENITCIIDSKLKVTEDVYFCSENWVCFKIDAQLDFDLSGILLSYLSPLEKAGISVLITSSFDTDYIFIKESYKNSAIEEWNKNNITVATGWGWWCLKLSLKEHWYQAVWLWPLVVKMFLF